MDTKLTKLYNTIYYTKIKIIKDKIEHICIKTLNNTI